MSTTIFLCRPEWVSHARLGERCRQLLDAHETDRHSRFVSEDDAHLFLVAHALLRTALSSYRPRPPQAWRFRRSEHGKPELNEDIATIWFNLSHTRGLVACAISDEGEVGIDVEIVRRSMDVMPLAQAFFAPGEIAALDARGAAGKRSLFCALWTLKEALLKAWGVGLLAPMDSLAYDIGGGHIRARLSPNIAAPPCQLLLRPTAQHWLSLAMQSEARPPPVTSCWFVPFQGARSGPNVRCVATTSAIGRPGRCALRLRSVAPSGGRSHSDL